MGICKLKLISGAVDCPNTVPGMTTTLYLADARHISAIPAEEDYDADPVANSPKEISSDITFDTVTYPNTGWYTWTVGMDSMDNIISTQGELGQNYLSTEHQFQVYGRDALYDQMIEWALNLPLVIAGKTKKGVWKVVGDLNTPAYLTFTSQYGKRAGDFIGAECVLNVPAHGKMWPTYSGTFTMAS